MNKRTLIPVLTLILIVLGFAGAMGQDSWTVKLRDGSDYQGRLLRLEPGRYLLQSGGKLYELTDDDIDPSTFAQRSRRDAQAQRPVLETLRYDEVNADGTVGMHWEMHVVNESKKAITELRFGLAPWERAHADQRSYRDPYGNSLIPVYDPPAKDWNGLRGKRIQVSIPLRVPVAPGENMIINCQETTPRIEQTKKGLLYRNVGDYAENRLVWVKVRLPRNAKIASIIPQPASRFSHDGYEYVTWRRYYSKGERIPLEILYTIR